VPSLVTVLALSLAGIGLGIEHVQSVDAARVGARMLARGESWAASMGQVGAAAPPGARVSADVAGGLVQVTVTAPAPRPLAVLGVPGASASASAMLERP
jgi:hypothetical protein